MMTTEPWFCFRYHIKAHYLLYDNAVTISTQTLNCCQWLSDFCTMSHSISCVPYNTTNLRVQIAIIRENTSHPCHLQCLLVFCVPASPPFRTKLQFFSLDPRISEFIVIYVIMVLSAVWKTLSFIHSTILPLSLTQVSEKTPHLHTRDVVTALRDYHGASIPIKSLFLPLSIPSEFWSEKTLISP